MVIRLRSPSDRPVRAAQTPPPPRGWRAAGIALLTGTLLLLLWVAGTIAWTDMERVATASAQATAVEHQTRVLAGLIHASGPASAADARRAELAVRRLAALTAGRSQDRTDLDTLARAIARWRTAGHPRSAAAPAPRAIIAPILLRIVQRADWRLAGAARRSAQGVQRATLIVALAVVLAIGGIVAAAALMWHTLRLRERREAERVALTAHATAAQTEAARADARARFLAAASSRLSQTLDVDTLLDTTARLAVGHLADVVVLYTREADAFQCAAVYAANPDDQRQVHLLASEPALTPTSPLWPQLTAAASTRHAHVDPAGRRQLSSSEAAAAALAAIDATSCLVVPLRSRAGSVAALLCWHTRHAAPFTAADQRLADELATRVGFALENGMLYMAATRELARRAEVEAARALSETRLAEAQRMAHVGWWEYDPDRRELRYSDEIARLLGIGDTSGTVSALALARAFPDGGPHRLAHLLARCGRALRAGEVVLDRLQRPDGSVRHVAIRARRLDTPAGRAHLIGVAQDITTLANAEHRVHAHEQRMRVLVEQASDVIYQVRHDLVIEYMNPAIRLVTDNEPAAYVNQPLHRLPFAEGMYTRVAAAVHDVMATGQDANVEYALHTARGLAWFQTRITREHTDVGAMPSVLGISREITEEVSRRAIEQMLTQASVALGASLDFEETLPAVLRAGVPTFADWSLVYAYTDHGPTRIAAVAADPDKQRALSALGTSPVPQFIRDEMYAPDAMVLAGTADEAYAYLRAHGVADDLVQVTRPVSLLLAPMRTPTGRPLGVLLFAHSESGRTYAAADLTVARELAQRAAWAVEHALLYRTLTATEAKYRQLFEHNPQPLFVVDEQTLTLLDANTAAAEVYGYPRETLLALGLLPLIAPDALLQEGERLEAPMPAQDLVYGSLHRRASGEVFPVEVHQHAMSLGGHAARLIAPVDVTERRRLQHHEAQLRSAERLALLGELADGVLHDIAQPLGTVINLAHALQQTPTTESLATVQAEVQMIAQEARRAAAVGARLRPRTEAPRDVVDLFELAQDHLDALRPLLRDANVVSTMYRADGPLVVRADRVQLGRVLGNLFTNALDAMAPHGGGRLEVHLASSASGVSMQIRDTGPGIPPEHFPHLFTHMWTTKPPGKGSGIGLASSRKIVRDHQGSLLAANTPSGGAAFTITLPHLALERSALEGSPTARPAPLASPVPEPMPEQVPEMAARHGETAVEAPPRLHMTVSDPVGRRRPLRVAVVDDEDAFRTSAAILLRRYLGAEVSETADGLEVVNWLAANTVDLALIDIRMPEFSGPEIWETVQTLAPSATKRIVFMTGDGHHPETARFLAQANRPMIPKPFVLDRVVATMTEAAHELGEATLRIDGGAHTATDLR